jgi:hypothetical protein
MTAGPQPAWDAFISHASEDKSYVRELATQLGRLGARVWYDEFELRPGDSLVGSIDKGLAESNYGVLVVTRSFLGKPWPEYERRGLTSRHIVEGRVLVPVWRGVGREEVATFSPSLADMFAIDASDEDPLTTAIRVIAVIRPDRFESLSRRAALDRILEGGERRVVPTADISRERPVRHPRLPAGLLLRVRIIHEVFLSVFDTTWEETVRNFKADTRPDREVEVWEGMAAVYLEICNDMALNVEQSSALFAIILAHSSGTPHQPHHDPAMIARVEQAYASLARLMRDERTRDER